MKALPKPCRQAVFLALAALFSAMSLFGQSAEEAPIIERIAVQVEGQPGDPSLLGLIALRQGEFLSPVRIAQSIKQIYQTGLYSDIQVRQSGKGRVELVFELTRRLLLRNVSFSGGVETPAKKLRMALESLKPGAAFTEEKTARAEGELREALRLDGFFSPEISSTIEKSPEASQVDVTFAISSWKRYTVGRLGFQGTLVVTEDKLRHLIKTREGSVYVPSLLSEDLSALAAFYNSQGFRRAEVRLETERFDAAGGSVDLLIRVSPQEKISIVINGADIPEGLVTPIWEERIFEEWGLAEGEARILEHLRKKGRIFSSVNSRIERTENETRIIYEVSPGEKYKIKKVSFEGLKSFTPARLKAAVGIGKVLPFFSVIDGRRLFELPRDIELFYESQGFPACRVEVNVLKRKGTAEAVFFVDEGVPQKVGRVVIEGARLFSADELRAGLVSSEGGAFFKPNIQKDLERIETFYLNRGVRGTRVAADVRPVDPNLFDLQFSISEGEKVTVDNIIITGNKVTRRSTILKEVRNRPGEEASFEKIRESKGRLERLGVFSEVRIEEIQVSPGHENLVINVREGERNYAGLGIGVETKKEPRSFALWENGMALRGTAEFIRSNLLGIAAQISLVTQFSLVEKRAVVSWEQPYFFGLPMQTLMNAWLEGEDRLSFGFDRRGVSLTAMKPLFKNMLLLATMSYSRTKLTFLEIAESEVDRQLFPYSTTLLSASLIWDRRDDTFNPGKGFFLSAVSEWAYPLFKTESDYLKTFLKFQHFYPIITNLNFSTTARLGLGRGRMPIPERFFAGGSNSFRGEAFDALGPKDPDSEMPVGGKAMFVLNLELKFPVLQSLPDLAGAVFYDLGNVFSKRSEFSLFDLRGALGLGLRYRTPLGPLRFDLAWDLDSPTRRGRPLMFITIGNVF